MSLGFPNTTDTGGVNYVVINILKDGTVVEDMSKITVPRNETTIRAYELIAKGGFKNEYNTRNTNGN